MKTGSIYGKLFDHWLIDMNILYAMTLVRLHTDVVVETVSISHNRPDICINRTSQGSNVTPNELLLNELQMNWHRQHLSLYLLISQVKMLPSKPEVRRRPVLRSYSMFLTQFV